MFKFLYCFPCINYNLMCEFQLKFLQREVEFKTVAKEEDTECLQGFFFFSFFFFCNFLPIHPANFFSFIFIKSILSIQVHFYANIHTFMQSVDTLCHTHISSIKVYLKFIIAVIMLTGINKFRNEHKWFWVMIQLKWYKQAFEQGFECAMDNYLHILQSWLTKGQLRIFY